MNYEQALDYVHNIPRFGGERNLNRITALLNELGNPQDDLKFIHIAGTNGKGSTVTMCDKILTLAGYKCGKYTSPFIVDFRERFQVNGEMISQDDFSRLATKVKISIDKLTSEGVVITEFDTITAIAFMYFKEQNCDIVVLEVGLGGRFDSTNIIKTPLVSGIMSISLDHTNILGDTVEQIAFEKSGIIKQNGQVVCYPMQDVNAIGVIMEKCASVNAQFILPSLSTLEILSQDENGSEFMLNDEHFKVALAGEHQIYNAITAINIINIVKSKGFDISMEQIKLGLSTVSFYARFEIVSKNPFIVLDGAHNLEGITVLVNTLKKVKYSKLVVIMGMLSDKDYKHSTKIISEIADSVICVDVSMARTLSANELCEKCKPYCDDTIAIEDMEKALSLAKTRLENQDDLLLCCGSLYMVSEIRTHLKQ